MGEYFFLGALGRATGEQRARFVEVAKRHGARFSNPHIPGDGDRYWFSCENLGDPHDRDVERAVIADLTAEGLLTTAGFLVLAAPRKPRKER